MEKSKNKFKIKNSKGITLIALVITIVVLIILAGVAINLTLSSNGIFNKAKEAKEQYLNAQEAEQEKINILSSQLSNGEVSEENTPTVTTYSVTFNGTNVTSNGVSSVNENETYTATLTAMSGYSITSVVVTMGETTLVENTGYTYSSGNLSIPNVSGNIVIIASVYAPYDNPYIPVGFTHIGTADWNSGYQIRETATGNVFVWVPCVTDQSKVKSGDTVQTFQKTTTGKYNSNSFGLSPTDASVTDVDPTEAIRTSVGTYGGFYIAAYEAGVPVDNNGNEIAATSAKTSQKARSVAGVTVWTNITITNAKDAAENMITTTSDGVKSGLISGECWDTTLQWMVNSSTNATNEPNVGYDTNSTGKGWYKETPSNSTRHTTGYYAVNNIYDMAGNVWEWTTENCTYRGISSLLYRGGSYDNSGSVCPAAYRGFNFGDAVSNLGFRVVLYK